MSTVTNETNGTKVNEKPSRTAARRAERAQGPGEYLKAWGPLDRVAGGRGSCRWGPVAAGVGATGPQRLISPVHGGVFTHVVVAGIDPDGVVHDAVHDRVGVHS